MVGFQTQTGKAKGGLSTAAVFLGEVYRIALEDLLGVALDGCKENSISIDNDKSISI